MSIVHLSDGEFERQVLESKQLVLVDFWAPWCGPCQMLAPILEELSEAYNDKLKICKMNVDEHQKVATRYQVLSIPALIFFKDGKVATQLVGARPTSEIKKTIDSLMDK